ncbi:MAG: ligase-associated DNA damage response endonuclease PdeM [Pseudomonadota bacterium]|nr:ligase-associated DNA damage response endonuclease PdeM [Pseudomonadota bacterium]
MRIRVNGETLVLDAAGALWWPQARALVLADLHFEKGSAYARGGTYLPPYDTRATLKRIAALQERYRPEMVIALGDSFHDGGADARLDAGERAQMAALVAAVDWIWIAGNHDPEPPIWLGGRAVSQLAQGGLFFRHDPSLRPEPGEIAGHLHPCHTVSRYGRALRRRCFVSDGNRLVMPAFGAYAGGLDLRDEVFGRLFPRACIAYMLGTQRVYAVAA